MPYHRRALLGSLAALPLLPGTAGAQGWPSRPVRFIVGYAAGGTIDVAARMLGEKLSPAWGQPIAVENRTGAGGTIGALSVVRSAPDGHTLLISAAPEVAVARFTQANLPYDPQKDLAPITLIARNPFALVVTPSVPARTLGELIAHARRTPLSYGTSGAGTTTHFVAEQFRQATGLEIEHVPYRGSAAMMPDLLAGRVQLAFDAIPAVLPHIREGRLRALGVATERRASLAPDIPTLSEAGLPGFVGGGWVGVLGPAGMAPDLISRLEADFRAAMAAGVGAELEARGFEPVSSDAAEFKAFIAAEEARWGVVAQRAGIRPG
jgi:tripartite-type tricarboxylate transporter receptor subunit TctC